MAGRCPSATCGASASACTRRRASWWPSPTGTTTSAARPRVPATARFAASTSASTSWRTSRCSCSPTSPLPRTSVGAHVREGGAGKGWGGSPPHPPSLGPAPEGSGCSLRSVLPTLLSPSSHPRKCFHCVHRLVPQPHAAHLHSLAADQEARSKSGGTA